MRKRIDAKTDFNIMAEIALEIPAKEIAKKYGVSVSYISKVKTGRKKVDVYIPEGVVESNKLLYYKTDIDLLEEFFKQNPMSLTNEETETLDSLIIQKLSELKVLLETRKVLQNKKENQV